MAKAINTLKVRLLQKFGLYEEWESIKDSLVLLKGELGLVKFPLEDGTSVYLAKVGDGISTFGALPYISAKAADVYEWAKAEEKPVYEASEIVGIEKIDTNTSYKIEIDSEDPGLLHFYSKEKGQQYWNRENSISLIANVSEDEVEEKVRKIIKELNIEADRNFIFNQDNNSEIWTIKHDLKKNPAVQTFDKENHQIIGEINHIDKSNLTITFSAPISGIAYLN